MTLEAMMTGTDRSSEVATDGGRVQLAIADLTSTLTNDFDLPAMLHSVAEHARVCFGASTVVVLLLDRRAPGRGVVHIVAEAASEGHSVDPRFHTSGPGLMSASESAVAMVDDLAHADDTRWPEYRERATAAGLRGMRAFPVSALGVPLGSIVVHTEDPWGDARPRSFGQILADLTAIGLASGTVDGRRLSTSDAVDSVLRGSATIAAAVGILTEYLRLEPDIARLRLNRLARARGLTVTAQARMIVDAHNSSPGDLERTGVLSPANVSSARLIGRD
ncbi:GAF domain-containing protein [Hoyosella altamirensis]|uniref:GAF domain-containing protein n=1 Tax=Hoyosella altamirensis TaxID=616997 RepID=A0A839RQW6_9ACTN|nr:GAF domain-containing protein [Hoyosella altamirensis]MBB3038767.1 GAF domain-containing protein [Hoyosella altamirensis]